MKRTIHMMVLALSLLSVGATQADAVPDVSAPQTATAEVVQATPAPRPAVSPQITADRVSITAQSVILTGPITVTGGMATDRVSARRQKGRRSGHTAFSPRRGRHHVASAASPRKHRSSNRPSASRGVSASGAHVNVPGPGVVERTIQSVRSIPGWVNNELRALRGDTNRNTREIRQIAESVNVLKKDSDGFSERLAKLEKSSVSQADLAQAEASWKHDVAKDIDNPRSEIGRATTKKFGDFEEYLSSKYLNDIGSKPSWPLVVIAASLISLAALAAFALRRR